MKTKISILAVLCFIQLLSSCKKKDESSDTNNPSPCNFTTNVFEIDGVSKNILSDSCRVFGTNYYTEHWVDAGKTEGIAIIFDGTAAPAAGNYTAVNSLPAVTPTTAYVEYYVATSSYQPSGGTITVTDDGSSKVYTFCKFPCTDGTTTKTISVRATCN